MTHLNSNIFQRQTSKWQSGNQQSIKQQDVIRSALCQLPFMIASLMALFRLSPNTSAAAEKTTVKVA